MYQRKLDSLRPRKPEPSPLIIGNAVCGVVVSVWVVLSGVLEIFAPTNPFALMGTVCCAPGFLALGVTQAVAVFRRSEGAARIAWGLSICAAGLLGLSLLLSLGSCLSPRGWFYPEDVRSLIVLALGTGYAIFCTWVNRRWTMVLERPLPAGFCIFCGYDLRAASGRCPECGQPG